MKRAIWATSAITALVFSIGLGWIALRRTHDLDRRLQDTEGQADDLGRKAQSQARHLERTLEFATAARDSVEAAARRALDAAAARISAEARTQASEEARKAAEGDALEATKELIAIRERREQELNRMDEALARIAATRRTSSGLVIDLRNDSFHFDFDKAALRPENRELLRRIAGVLLASNGYQLFIGTRMTLDPTSTIKSSPRGVPKASQATWYPPELTQPLWKLAVSAREALGLKANRPQIGRRIGASKSSSSTAAFITRGKFGGTAGVDLPMPSADLNFRTFGPTHLAILIAIPAISALLTWMARRRPRRTMAVRITLGGFLAAASLGWHGYCLLRGWIQFPDSLPIAICDVSLLLSAVALLTLHPWAYEFAYYNGFGALMAVLTPDLWESFPSPSTVQFFVGHCGILIAVIFLTSTGILRPRKGSAWRTFVAVNILAAMVAVFDVVTGTNYLYLAAKPRTASILDHLGPWPFYLVASEAVMLLIFSLMELPFRSIGYRRREPARATSPFPGNTSSLLGIRIPISKS